MTNATPRSETDVFDRRRQAVGRAVLALIESRRMSFADASAATGISKTGLYKIADGQSDPCLSSLYKIADFFGVPVAALLEPAPAPVGADKTDSARWRALTAATTHIRILGSALLGSPDGHMGVEITGQHTRESSAENRAEFTTFVDGLRQSSAAGAPARGAEGAG